MGIKSISRSEFNDLGVLSSPIARIIAEEKAWFISDNSQIAGCLLLDKYDKDWNFVILGKQTDGFRAIDMESSIQTRESAISQLTGLMSEYERYGQRKENIFESDAVEEEEEEVKISLVDINNELKEYFAKHPEKLYDLTPRKFEELVASIMEDFGFDVNLTQQTRDGGRDIFAYMKNAVCNFLTFVECKKYAHDNKVGVEVVRNVIGVHHLHGPSKSLIVTTSYFTKDAIKEAKSAKHILNLNDFNDIKVWLQKYGR